MALTAAQIEQQKQAGRGTALLRPADARLRQGPVLRPFQRPACSSLSATFVPRNVSASTTSRRRGAPLLRRTHRRGRHRPQRRDSARSGRRPRAARRAGHDRAEGVRRPGFSQLAYCRIMEVIGGHDAGVGRLRQRPSQHRHPRPAAVRHRGTETPLAAAAGQRRTARRLRPDRTGGRLRRQQCADHRHADAGRQGLHPQRDQTLDHQRRHRRRADRHGAHAGAGGRTRRRKSPPFS